MAPAIDWITKIITIPQSDLTYISDLVYELDTNQFRKDLKAIEASENGIVFEDTHKHNPEVTLAGATYSRFFEVLNANGFTVTFEDGQYAVNLKGTNNNIADVANLNQVSIRSFNSAGLQTVSTGSDLTEVNEKLTRLLGLSQENFRLVNQVYNTSNKLTSAVIRTYPNAGDCEANQNILAEYMVTASYNTAGNCTSYKVAKQ